jgi:hypothetical protein
VSHIHFQLNRTSLVMSLSNYTLQNCRTTTTN